MIEMADAAVISSALLAFGGVGITGMCKWRPRGTNGFVSKNLCDERSHNIEQSVARIELKVDKLIDKIDGLKR